MLPVAILAGGLATRLRPLTETIPKALVEVAGRPFIHHQLTALRQQGIEQVVLCLGYRGEMIEQEIGDGSAFDLDVCYAHDGPALLGTGGALRQALPLLGDAFFVLYGDSYLRCDYPAIEAAFRASGQPALMTVLENRDRWDQSNIIFRAGQIICYDKRQRNPEMQHIDYGLGIISATLLRNYPPNTAFDLADIYRELAETGRLAGYEVSERFYEIGSPQGLAETEEFLKNWIFHELHSKPN